MRISATGFRAMSLCIESEHRYTRGGYMQVNRLREEGREEKEGEEKEKGREEVGGEVRKRREGSRKWEEKRNRIEWSWGGGGLSQLQLLP